MPAYFYHAFGVRGFVNESAIAIRRRVVTVFPNLEIVVFIISDRGLRVVK